MPENPDRHDEQLNGAAHSHEEDQQATRRIERESAVNEPEQPDGEAEQPEKPGLLDNFRRAYTQARDGRKPSSNTQKQDRSAKGRDKSKGLMVIAAAAFIMFFVFIAMFSHSNRPGSEARRNTPSLGRPEQLPGQKQSGSAVPLQNADMSGQDNDKDEVSPDDLNKMAKRRLPSEQPKTLAGVPPMDPTLEAYQRARDGIAPPPPPPPPPPPAPTTAAAPVPAHNEADGLKKSSLVFVRNAANTSSQGATLQPASYSAEPALLERKNSGLPNGSRLVARLQAAVSTAVKTPVVASIEYNYERDGEIIIPAGTKAFGELAQANRQGIVSVHFHTLQMPDGTVQKIDGTAMSLGYGPLKGSVSGSNRLKRVLVRSLTGVGEMAAFLVGGPGGFSGASGALDNSVLLRERIASNAGLAGEQEFSSLAANEQIVVTVAANTRFFIVLVDSSNQDRSPRLTPTGGQREKTQLAAAQESALPSASELRELIDLKSELNRMYQQVSATRASEPAAAPGQQQQPQQDQ
jgi:hypothetical protein